MSDRPYALQHHRFTDVPATKADALVAEAHAIGVQARIDEDRVRPDGDDRVDVVIVFLDGRSLVALERFIELDFTHPHDPVDHVLAAAWGSPLAAHVLNGAGSAELRQRLVNAAPYADVDAPNVDREQSGLARFLVAAGAEAERSGLAAAKASALLRELAEQRPTLRTVDVEMQEHSSWSPPPNLLPTWTYWRSRLLDLAAVCDVIEVEANRQSVRVDSEIAELPETVRPSRVDSEALRLARNLSKLGATYSPED